MADRKRHPLISGARVTSLGTLTSRLLGMVRDMATAALLGMSRGGVMDAFAVAFRIPNLFRRLFGEGALAASYLPEFSAQLEKDRTAAWRLASVTMTWLAVLLVGLILVCEGIVGLAWLVWGEATGAGLLLGLAAVLIPYTFFICLAAQVAATLHALGHFTAPAFAPALLNVCWLVAAWAIAPLFTPDRTAQAYVLAGAVLAAGVVQLGIQLPVLRRRGFRFDYHWPSARDGLGRIARAMTPMLLGLAVTQVNTLLDSLIAWGLAAEPDGPQAFSCFGATIAYPMEQGAAAAIYYGERLYQFPLGILGIAVATAIFPLLSRHAARGEHGKLGADLTLGLRLVVFLGVPASVGLLMLAEPLARLLYERGEFTPDDTARAARMIACYGLGVWAYCAMPVIVRGYYALGDRATPVRVGAMAVVLNLTLNLTLIWALAEAGLAVATALSATVQVMLLALLFSRRKVPLGWRPLGGTALRTAIATAAMAAAGFGVLAWLGPADGLGDELAQVFAPLAASMAVYFGVYRLLGGREPAILAGREDV